MRIAGRTILIVIAFALAIFGLVEFALWTVPQSFPQSGKQLREWVDRYNALALLSDGLEYLLQSVANAWEQMNQPQNGQLPPPRMRFHETPTEFCFCFTKDTQPVPAPTPLRELVWQFVVTLRIPFIVLIGLGILSALDRLSLGNASLLRFMFAVPRLALQIAGFLVFLYLLHAIGFALWTWIAQWPPLQLLLEFTVFVIVELSTLLFGWLPPWVLIVLAVVLFSLLVVLLVVLWQSFIKERIDSIQQKLHSLWIGEVHPTFPRAPQADAEHLAAGRRKNIKEFLESGKLPALRTEYRLAPGDQRKVREHVVRREVEEEGPPHLVTEFLEFPPRGPMVLKQPCLPEGPEEAVGQFVRLNFELQQPAQRPWWLRLWAYERYEETIVPLLARVVDAANLADLHANSLRREAGWPAMPFYERIYAEYRPMPFLIRYLLRPYIGNGMPARVVIETHYPEVFFTALFANPESTVRRRALRYARAYKNWFGIGIQIEPPNMPRKRWGWRLEPMRHSRVAWAGAHREPLCRRLKSHASSVLSGRIDIRFTDDPPLGQQAISRDDAYRIMPSGPLADGCPSVVRPARYPATSTTAAPPSKPPKPLPAEFERVEIPIAAARFGFECAARMVVSAQEWALSRLPQQLSVIPGAYCRTGDGDRQNCHRHDIAAVEPSSAPLSGTGSQMAVPARLVGRVLRSKFGHCEPVPALRLFISREANGGDLKKRCRICAAGLRSRCSASAGSVRCAGSADTTAGIRSAACSSRRKVPSMPATSCCQSRYFTIISTISRSATKC